MSKIQIYKQITTLALLAYKHGLVYLICQRYKFISKSQRYRPRGSLVWGVFDMSKIQIYKQITTQFAWFVHISVVYLICQRYKFISKSQLFAVQLKTKTGVFDMSKIQIYKQITTTAQAQYIFKPVYLICQRYKFISKSQLSVCVPILGKGCIWYVKDTNL